MTKFSLMAKNSEGNASHSPLPTLMTQVFFDVNTAQLAVIFDIKNSPNIEFYPHFSQNSTFDIVTLQQDFLWEKSCYELFLAFDNANNSPYVEINFSPKGEFNLYHFDSYRTPSHMPPRRLQVTEKQRRHLLNCYTVSQDWHAVFWQDSLLPQQELRNFIEKKFPLETESHRLVMIVDMAILAKLIQTQLTDNICLNPCAVFLNPQGEQALAYFSHQHANPPDFHDKDVWLTVE